jgi:hypothetical protein
MWQPSARSTLSSVSRDDTFETEAGARWIAGYPVGELAQKV